MKSSDDPETTAAFREHLLILPKLDKMQYITAYLKQQSSFTKIYALQGPALSTIEVIQDNSTVPTTMPTHQQVTGEVGFGFSTPVLKPRKPITARIINIINNSPLSGDIPVISHGVSPEIVQNAGEENVQPPDKPTKKSSIAIEVKDHKARLEERRRRRRDKQGITKTKIGNQDLVDSEQGHPLKKKRTDIANAGYALMHGFLATNVGKDRLTIKASFRNTGVFGKGKASTATKTMVGTKRPTAKDFQIPQFLESEFLNKSKRSTRKRKLSNLEGSSLVSVNRDECTKQASKKSKIHPAISTTEVYKTTGNKSPKSNHHPVTQSDSYSNVNEEPTRCGDFTKSIIWDIEKDDVNELPSSPGQPSEERLKVLSQTLSVQNMSNGQSIGEDGHIVSLGDKEVISLCPSESASQHGHVETSNLIQTLEKSKYFARPMIPNDGLKANIAIPSVLEPKEGLNPLSIPAPEIPKQGTCLSHTTIQEDLEWDEPRCDLRSMSVDYESQSGAQNFALYAGLDIIDYPQLLDTDAQYGGTLNDELSYTSLYQEAIETLSCYFDANNFQDITLEDRDNEHFVYESHVELASSIDDERDQELMSEEYGWKPQSAVSSNISEDQCIYGSSLDGGSGDLLLRPITDPHVLPLRWGSQGPLAITTVEANVARLLKHHWLPQKL